MPVTTYTAHAHKNFALLFVLTPASTDTIKSTNMGWQSYLVIVNNEEELKQVLDPVVEHNDPPWKEDGYQNPSPDPTMGD